MVQLSSFFLACYGIELFEMYIWESRAHMESGSFVVDAAPVEGPPHAELCHYKSVWNIGNAMFTTGFPIVHNMYVLHACFHSLKVGEIV